MSQVVAVLVNGKSIIEYDRSKSLTERQQEYLDKMDSQMDLGISLAGQSISRPDTIERARFIASMLIQAIEEDDEPRIAATCSYLAERLPELKQVRANLQGGAHTIDLVFDRELNNQVQVEFDPVAGKSRFH